MEDKDFETEKRPAFGNRFLTDENDVFKHNAWDNVEWNEEQELQAKLAIEKNSKIKFTDEDIKKFEEDADKYWDQFYDIHDNKFFKDRHWLFTEFPELAPKLDKEEEKNMKPRSIFELGCGVGNTILPILSYSMEKNLKVYGCDFSSKAIDILKEHSNFDSERAEVFVMDVTKENWSVPFEESSIDIIILIFVLSAINPSKMENVAKNCSKYLKPGGMVILRDYGRYDLAQLRFKEGKCLQDNFYVRGDGTRVYFFTQEEIKQLFEKVGLVEEQNVIDRRLQVNRSRLLKMYRVWIQAKYKKPALDCST
ncbi:tRNA N(3)-methylcytidine methyltransferase Mettl2 isoform X2 [Condylostylus longicornis]|uniref:tRNA N(3)-methylcytidine methyltransferase Mettl2 isoform X2 n=1 Tax=Condylostylus longicornis TaxID=2530218 RepID=UPI00244DBC0B|nr:tRNA N(3)-methylcytidine methyltransferase Mettl2 isoform X2 [Condylostylus longicornis]